MTPDAARALADKLVLDVCELPNRTSPDEWPEAMLVTGEELHAMAMEAFQAFAAQVRREALEDAIDACPGGSKMGGLYRIGYWDGVEAQEAAIRALLNAPEPAAPEPAAPQCPPPS